MKVDIIDITVKEIANAFGMSINQLVGISGYSRQGLYNVVEQKKDINVNENRLNAFIDHLALISESIHEQDISEARIQLVKRSKLLEELRGGKE